MENSRSDVPMPLQPLDPLHKYSLPYESIWNGALYSTFWMKINSQNVLVWLSKMVWHNIFAPDAETGKRHKESLTPAVDWLDALIGPGGLLLLLSDLLQSQFQFYGWGQNKEIHNNFIKEIASCWRVTYWAWVELVSEVHFIKIYYASQFSAASGVVEWSWFNIVPIVLLNFLHVISCRDLTDDCIAHRVVRMKPYMLYSMGI
jgi:hypothetical protein